MEEEINTNTDLLLEFLQKLQNDIKTKTISETDLMLVGELYRTYRFNEEVLDVINESNKGFDEKELIKFMILGWYIYCIALKQKKI